MPQAAQNEDDVSTSFSALIFFFNQRSYEILSSVGRYPRCDSSDEPLKNAYRRQAKRGIKSSFNEQVEVDDADG
jgi:hypothetical protein